MKKNLLLTCLLTLAYVSVFSQQWYYLTDTYFINHFAGTQLNSSDFEITKYQWMPDISQDDELIVPNISKNWSWVDLKLLTNQSIDMTGHKKVYVEAKVSQDITLTVTLMAKDGSSSYSQFSLDFQATGNYEQYEVDVTGSWADLSQINEVKIARGDNPDIGCELRVKHLSLGIGFPSKTLTVNNGTGSGTYAENQEVEISANAPPTGKVFNMWSGDVANLANPNAANTTITMPGTDASVTANYQCGAPPPVPVDINTQAGYQQITFTWTAVADADGYKIYYGEDDGGPYPNVVTINGGSTTSKTITELTNGTTYYYVMTTVKGDCESDWSNQSSEAPVSNIQDFTGEDCDISTAETTGNNLGNVTVLKVDGNVDLGMYSYFSLGYYLEIETTFADDDLGACIVFKYDSDDFPSGLKENSLKLFRSTDGGKTWEIMDNSVVDLEANTITVCDVDHFSLWAAGGQVPPVPLSMWGIILCFVLAGLVITIKILR